MNEDRIKIKMRPEIIAKASPNLQNIDAKAVAGVTDEDIIERNVIAEYRDNDEGSESDEAGTTGIELQAESDL